MTILCLLPDLSIVSFISEVEKVVFFVVFLESGPSFHEGDDHHKSLG